jgi:hypothetical protein
MQESSFHSSLQSRQLAENSDRRSDDGGIGATRGIDHMSDTPQHSSCIHISNAPPAHEGHERTQMHVSTTNNSHEPPVSNREDASITDAIPHHIQMDRNEYTNSNINKISGKYAESWMSAEAKPPHSPATTTYKEPSLLLLPVRSETVCLSDRHMHEEASAPPMHASLAVGHAVPASGTYPVVKHIYPLNRALTHAAHNDQR